MTPAQTHTPKSRSADFVWKPLIMLAVVAVLLLVCAALWYFSGHSKLLAELRDETETADRDAGTPYGTMAR